MRRGLVTAACGVALALGGCSSTVNPSGGASASAEPTASPTPTASSPPVTGITPVPSAIVAENLHVGSSGWRMGGSGYRIATDRGAEIKGYASATSVEAGQQITLFASVLPVQQLKVDIYRLGWYGGTGGRLMLGGTWLPGITQRPCPIDAVTGLRACDWLPTVRFTVPTNWVSGLYLAVLTNADQFQNGVPFVVRADASTAPLLYVQPITTYQAYNTWPWDDGGRSLYGRNAAVKVSFDRPYAGSGVGKLYSDQPFAAWLERAGYNVTYATSIDLDRQGAALLLRHRVMVVAGHDEYWTAGMRAAATTARDNGVSLAFFAANNVYWQARLEPAADGRPDRVLVCYKSAVRDPIADPALKTVRWREPPVNQPEESLLGAQYTNMVRGRAAWVVVDAGSWVYRGTNLSNGQQIADLVFGESDQPTIFPVRDSDPTVVVLSDSPYRTWAGGLGRSQATLYQAASGAWVFDAGTFGWPGAVNPFGKPGLPGEPPPTPDLRVERMTANLLDRMTGVTANPSQVGHGFMATDGE